MQPKYDILWKGMVEEVIEDLLQFVEPDIVNHLALERGFEFLDKELAEIYPEPDQPSKTRVVDKLVKAFLRDGSERWMLFHLEVQGGNSKDFPSRMFNYFIRLFSKYGRWRLQVKGTDEEIDSVLLHQKLRIVRLLKERMAIFGERKTRVILIFLKNYVVFKESETNRKFMEQTDQLLVKSNTMGIFEQLAEIKHEEGIQEGLEKAIRGLLANTDMAPSKIAESVGVPIDLVEKVKNEMK